MSYLNKWVKIKWWDHCSYHLHQWRRLEEYHELTPMLMTSIGYVVKETKKYITVVSHMSDAESGCGDMTIIKAAIKSIKEIH